MRPVSQAQQHALAALLAAADRQPRAPEPQQRTKPLYKQQQAAAAQQARIPQQQQPHQRHQVPTLTKMCTTVLAQHVTALVEQLGDQLQWLPADMRAVLLAVARRRGEVTGLMLSCLADDSWRQLDLAGCSKLYGAELLAAAARMPHLTALDVTGCGRISAGGWRQLAQVCPHLEVVRLGGSAECSEAALKALPHILPGVPPPPHKAAAAAAAQPPAGSGRASVPSAPTEAAAADSWEDAFASDSDSDEGAQTSQHNAAAADSSSCRPQPEGQSEAGSIAAGSGGRLKHLHALIWPDVPSAAVELVQQRCPRVLVNPVLQPDRLTGEMPSREWDPVQPLDEPCMQMVLPEALHTASAEAVAAMAAASHTRQQQQQEAVVHIADKFRQAYIDRARRLKEKERRLAAAAERKQLKASHALRTLDAWLDEQE